MYRCEACPVMEQISSLRPENFEAWQTFRRICTRFVMEEKVMGIVVERTTAGLDADDALDLVTRLSILYDVYYPPRREGAKHGA